jgi:hypothetical protein
MRTIALVLAVLLAGCQIDTNGYRHEASKPPPPACQKEVRPGVTQFKTC